MRSACCYVTALLTLCASHTVLAQSPTTAANAAKSFGMAGLERVKYNHPGLMVDLGVGLWAWPLPMDFDGDGDLDLVVSCEDVPYNGTYVFENLSGKVKMPRFAPGRRISHGLPNVQISYVHGGWRVLSPGCEYPEFRTTGLEDGVKLPVPANIHKNGVRANQWKYIDYDGDGLLDLVVGVGDWKDYGWDNAFDAQGHWTRGPLHGYVYFLKNVGTAQEPRYAEPQKVMAGNGPVDVFGMPSPNFADFDGDGDLDLVCGEFRDGLYYFENVGTRRAPRYAPVRPLRTTDGRPLTMDLCMVVPVAIDWDGDGDQDLIVGQEDGRVALVENTGRLAEHTPVFARPQFFQQVADDLKFGALVTPVGYDWDGDGDDDLVCGNSAGYIAVIENQGGYPPRWAAPRYLAHADGQPIRILAGPNGSIQGPAEAKWGYTVLNVADWDGDGLADLVVNSIWGAVVCYRNLGPKSAPRFAAAVPLEVEWPGTPPKPAWVWWQPKGKQLVTQWRTTPAVLDVNGDRLLDLVMLDPEGFLAVYRRARQGDRLVLLPPERMFCIETFREGRDAAEPFQFNRGKAGGSGRRKFCFADWDRDGRLDLLRDSRNVSFMHTVSIGPDRWVLSDEGQVDTRRLAGHDTCPTVVDWNHDGVPDLVAGAEDGCFYYLKNPHPAPRAKAQQGPPAKHLVAQWDFESAHGGPLADKASAGTVRDTLEALGGVKMAHGVATVPAAAGVGLRAQSSVDLEPGDELTLYARLRIQPPLRGIISLVDKRQFRDPESRSYGLYVMPTGKGFGLGGQVSGNGSGGRAISAPRGRESLPLGQWARLAMVVRRDGDRLSVAWYGRPDASSPAAAYQCLNGPTSVPRLGKIYRNQVPLVIGNTVDLRANPCVLEFDEVRIYNRALTAQELP
jgi:hypothetical protein